MEDVSLFGHCLRIGTKYRTILPPYVYHKAERKTTIISGFRYKDSPRAGGCLQDILLYYAA
jgi:hypothetical protein